jgi:hypothetical protein
MAAKSSTCNQIRDSGDNEEEREADKGRGGVVWDRGDGEFVLPNEPVAQEEEEEAGAGAREEEAVWQGVKAAAVLRERELQGDAQRQSGEHPRHPQRQMVCEQELDRGSMKREVLERGREGRREGESGGGREGRKQVSGDAGLSVGLVSGTACFSSVSEACVVSGDAEKLEAKEEEVKLQEAQDLSLAALAYEEVCVCVCVCV